MSRRAENQGFECASCGKRTGEHAWGSYRNHCPHCLYSLHVDVAPGDRANDCRAPMKPVGVDYSGKKGYMLIHECISCGGRHRNKCAPDDDMDAIIALAAPPR